MALYVRCVCGWLGSQEQLDKEKEEAEKERAKADKRQAQRVNALNIRRKLKQAYKGIDAQRDATTALIKAKLKDIKAKYKQESNNLKEIVLDKLHYLMQMTFNSDIQATWKAYSDGTPTLLCRWSPVRWPHRL